MSNLIEADGIGKYYGSYCALKNISLTVGTGEFVALVGPSGCGKTSLLKILAGFEDVSSGSLRIEGCDMRGIPPSARPTRMVFQKLALFPHKTVAENIGFSMKLARSSKDEIARAVQKMMSLMHLKAEYADRFPHELSGGEQQRVALARSMISSPSALLLDEPLSALDAKLKKSLQAELKRLHRTVGTSFVHVTHDLEEAMMLADRICVMRAGEILQIGQPSDIYYRPSNSFVAGFIGETNLLPADLRGVTGSEGVLHFDCPIITSSASILRAEQCGPGVGEGPALLMIRPEMLTFLKDSESADAEIVGRVDEFFDKGASIQYRISPISGTHVLNVEIPGSVHIPADVGDKVRLGFSPANVFAVRA